MISTKGPEATSCSNPDAPARHRWLPIPEVVDAMTLQPGMSIAESGAGRGDLILPAAEAIGDAGHAFAIEREPEMLAHLRERSRNSRNIHVVEAPYHATPMATGSCDRVLLANLWTELPDPIAALREAARLLRPEGRLILVEWHADAECPHAPRTRVGFDEMVRLLENNTWDIHRHGSLGPYSYFLEAAVSDESVQS
jgi:ubiquinone/menaquinone biosynthesis C-methylase UbiE